MTKTQKKKLKMSDWRFTLTCCWVFWQNWTSLLIILQLSFEFSFSFYSTCFEHKYDTFKHENLWIMYFTIYITHCWEIFHKKYFKACIKAYCRHWIRALKGVINRINPQKNHLRHFEYIYFCWSSIYHVQFMF